MHPYAGHKQKHVEKRRVKVLMRSGGVPHDDEKADRQLFKKLIREHESKHGGEKAHHRMDKYARGGRTKHKPHVSVNILTNPSPQPPGATGAAAGPPLPSPTGGGAPSLPPPGLGNPLMRKSGGRTNRDKPISNSNDSSYKSGISTPENLKKWAKYASQNSYASGGKVGMTAGAYSGEGRLQKKRAYGLKPHGKD